RGRAAARGLRGARAGAVAGAARPAAAGAAAAARAARPAAAGAAAAARAARGGGLLAGPAGAGAALPGPLLVALGRVGRLLGEAVAAGGRECRVVAPAGAVVVGLRAGDAADLVEPGLDQVDRQRGVAQVGGELLALAEEVVGELAERVALVGGEVAPGVGGHDEVGVAGQRVAAPVGVGVDVLQLLGEVHRRGLVAVDVGLQQGDRDVVGGGLDVVAGLVEDLDHREVGVERVGVLDVGDGADRVGRGHVPGHAQ